ncbi:MAG: SBBP repeat-containing protein [Bacteroidia bacterium]|nr:SBBP repeat-containing protein [Bacteroidia bacterium]MDW8301315.1 SBBP repeat-containing protein [Bacteroidia bacterium]
MFSQSAPTFAWAKPIAGSQSENILATFVDASGNIYVTGIFTGTVDMDPGPALVPLIPVGMTDIFVAKYSPAGSLIWAKQIGGPGQETGYSIVLDNTGNIYVTGVFENTVDFDPGPSAYDLTAVGGFDIFTLKLDPSGGFLWVNQCGGPEDEFSLNIALDNTGNLYIGGIFDGIVDFDPSPSVFSLNPIGRDLFIVKFTASTGAFQWAKRFASTTTTSFCNIGGLALDAAGNFYVTGGFGGTVDFDTGSGTYTLTSMGAQANLFVCKLDNTTALTWIKQVGASGATVSGRDLQIDNLNNVIVTGSFQGSCDFDPGAGTFNLTSNGLSDAFILKLNDVGSFAWAAGIGSTGYDDGEKIVVTQTNDIIVLGSYQGTVDFDPGLPIYQITSDMDSWDIFILKLNSTGNFEWVKSVGGPSWDQGFAICQDNSANLYIAGNFSDTCDFDPDASTFYLSATQFDAFILKLSAFPTYVESHQVEKLFDVYPTVTNNTLYIRPANQNYIVQIFDFSGKKVIELQNPTAIPVDNLCSGLYTVCIQNLTTNSLEYHKFIIQH